MNTVWLILKKEWKAFFYTPFAMLLVPLYLVLCGSYFTSNLDIYLNMIHPNETMAGAEAVIKGVNVMGFLLKPFFDSLLNIFVFIVALITMRAFAEEKKSATYELLVSYPISPWQILLGKYFGILSVVFSMLALSLIYPMIVGYFGHPYWPAVWTTYLGYLLFLMVYVAIGIWASLLTENQLVAAVMTYAAIFLSYLLGYFARIVGSPYDRIFANFLLVEHLDSFRDGLVFLGDITVYIVGMLIFLALALLRIKRHYA